MEEGCAERLISKLQYYLDTGDSSDVTFIVGSEEGNPCTFYAHRAIMAANSAVFQAMLYGGPSKKDVIFIPDVSSRSFSIMLRYFYTENLPVESLEDAISMCYAAKKYRVRPLLQECGEYIADNITPENACQLYEFATKMDIGAARDQCMIAFVFHTKDVMMSEGFKSATPATVADIVSSRYLAVPSEFFLLDAILQWGERECSRQGEEDLRTVVEPYLKYVRFAFMLPEHLLKLHNGYGVPSHDELVSILPLLGAVVPEGSIDVLPTITGRTKESFRNAAMEERLRCSLLRYCCSVEGPFTEVEGKEFSFGVEVAFGSLFLSVFCMFYKSLRGESSTVDAVISLTVPNRFTGLKFGRRLPIEEGVGVCFVYFPRAVFLEAGENLSVAVRFDGGFKDVYFKLNCDRFTSVCSQTPETNAARNTEKILFTLPCLTFSDSQFLM